MKKKFAIVVTHDVQQNNQEVCQRISSILKQGLIELNHEAVITNKYSTNFQNIILVDPTILEEKIAFPSGTILFNIFNLQTVKISNFLLYLQNYHIWEGRSETWLELLFQGLLHAQYVPITNLSSGSDEIDNPFLEFLSLAVKSAQTMPSQLLRFDLGCGAHKFPGFTGVDIYPALGVDIVTDLTSRYPFDDNTIDCIRAYDFIEHVSDRINTMNEIWRVCKEGALVNLLVPSSDGRGAFQDPTHVSFWNLNSFRYFSQEYPWFLKLCQQYGFKGRFSLLGLRQYEGKDQVIHVHALLKAIKTPAVDLPNKPVFVAITPDWHTSTDTLIQDIQIALMALAHHPDSQSICLVVDTSNEASTSVDSPEEMLVNAAMILMFEKNVDVEAEGIALTFADFQDPQQWRLLAPMLGYHLALSHESKTSEQIHTLPYVETFSPTAFAEQPLSLRFGYNTSTPKWLNEETSNSQIEIGDFTHAKAAINWQIYGENARISIGKFCLIEANVTICAGQSQTANTSSIHYPFNSIFNFQKAEQSLTPPPTQIGHDVQIGFGCYIAAGVSIGHGAIIQPGSWVFINVDPYTIVAGNPAQKIGELFSQEHIQYLLQLGWWDWPLSKILASLEQLQIAKLDAIFPG